jgi:RNA-directed DNA polymerase
MDNTVDWSHVQSIGELASFIKCERQVLHECSDSYDTRGRRYREFHIPKKSGSTRLIRAPISCLKEIQRLLANRMMESYDPLNCVHGFTPKRSIVSNAAPHVGRRYVLNVDLVDFFPSVNFGRVRGVFMANPFRCQANIATILARICCEENQLPQGAPTSPIVTNFICYRLDLALMKVARKHRVYYTRYADDLTFSCSSLTFPSSLAKKSNEGVRLGTALTIALSRNGFKENLAKLRLQGKTERQEVTGLVCNEKLNVPRARVRQVRAMLNAWDKYGLNAAQAEYNSRYADKHRRPSLGFPDFERVLYGRILFIRQVRGDDDPLVLKLMGRFHALNTSFDESKNRHGSAENRRAIDPNIRELAGGEEDLFIEGEDTRNYEDLAYREIQVEFGKLRKKYGKNWEYLPSEVQTKIASCRARAKEAAIHGWDAVLTPLCVMLEVEIRKRIFEPMKGAVLHDGRNVTCLNAEQKDAHRALRAFLKGKGRLSLGNFHYIVKACREAPEEHLFLHVNMYLYEVFGDDATALCCYVEKIGFEYHNLTETKTRTINEIRTDCAHGRSGEPDYPSRCATEVVGGFMMKRPIEFLLMLHSALNRYENAGRSRRIHRR